ncbi:hypothetical protein SYNPS1DRAFT_30296 [Syncephalis pseudoplumigaleata]|uniref:Uncharacterized protein n=1 Tax=Syncephalis pseudoplumigaleata TaxID=1712513 RepID=A0A4P9YUJ7_9FUNG|nr:hypothetical protein SYNPS1DRAFT_30735 [Syncephalis pseudoplumigaleata]RKP23931.1 hypothetical protein SYNPS1DRAFT_30296 [Syncephalis pseudoplumigaleata]|eukprot:RKP23514.1 hypothetical protein SYNPS1DRAFT_30735 [Syncephalis pseudoplumigaleata]
MIAPLVSRQLGRSALRMRRLYATETSSTASYPPEKGGTAKVWLFALAGMAGMVGWTELDRRITEDGKKEHPITRLVEDFRIDSSIWTQRNAKHHELVKDYVDDFFIFSTAKRPHMHRTRDPM